MHNVHQDGHVISNLKINKYCFCFFQLWCFFSLVLLSWNWIEKWKHSRWFLSDSNGLLDPCSGGGVLESLSPSLMAIQIPSGAHHLDLRAQNPGDTAEVRAAREQEKNIMKNWLYGAGDWLVWSIREHVGSQTASPLLVQNFSSSTFQDYIIHKSTVYFHSDKFFCLCLSIQQKNTATNPAPLTHAHT